MTDSSRVRIDRERHGPIERIVLTPLDPPTGASMSIFRIGDVLVDTGGSRVTDAVLAILAEDPPRRIVMTHQHEDHSGNLGPIRARFGALPVHVPRALVGFLPTFRSVPPYRRAYWGDPHPIPAEGLLPYDAGDVFEVGAHRIETMHTPGHTPPHHVLVVRDGDDTLVMSGDLYSSKPLEAFLESALDDTVRSYRRVAALGAGLRMLPTHGWVRANASTVLSEAADWLEREAEGIERDALALGSRDPRVIARHRYGEDRVLPMSQGEMGPSIFVRSAVEPVRTLPATPLQPASGSR